MNTSSEPAPARLGPYELIRRLATGGMAEVYLARRAGPHGFQKLVAVKRILPQFSRDPDFLAMFVDEARVCARLAHPNIVQVFDFGEQEGELYMAMEYVDGSTGARLIRDAAAGGEDIPLDVSLHVALSLLRALEYAHNTRDDEGRPLRLVHRDVSPANVLIDRSGAVKLTDFGIARATEFERRTDAGQLKGKLGYMSPEQVVGKELDARSDLFTVGIVFAEMVMLRPLFSGGRELDVLIRIRDADLSALDRTASRVPDDIRAVLYRALAHDPLSRYASAASFADAIEDIVRRRRLQVGPAKLAGWLERRGLVEATPQSDAADGPTESSSNAPDFDTATSEMPAEEPSPHRPTPPSEVLDVSPQIYRIKLHDGGVEGPMSYPRIIELFATGAVGRGTLIARESGRFKEPKTYGEFSRFITSPALRWDEDWPAEVVERRPLDRRLLPARMFRLSLARETGVLIAKDGPKRRKKIYLVEGVPEFVASTDKHELLGEYLISRGQVLRMEVEMALAMLPRFGGRIGDALVGLGVLRPVELFRAIHEQTQQRFLELFRWKAGEIGFVRGVRSQEETFPLGVDPFELIARGIQEAYAPAELDAMMTPRWHEVIEPAVIPSVRLETFRLPDRQAATLRALRAPMALGTMVIEAGTTGRADRYEVFAAIFIGLSCDLLRMERWDAP